MGDRGTAKARFVAHVLKRYPIPVPGDDMRYVPALDAAFKAFVSIKSRPAARACVAAFAAVAPRVLARGRALSSQVLNAIADGAPPQNLRTEFNAILDELSILAAVLVAQVGRKAVYDSVCVGIRGLLADSPRG